MAVKKLELVSLVGAIHDFEATLLLCVNDTLFHNEDTVNVINNMEGVSGFIEANPYTEIISRVRKLAEVAGINIEKFMSPDYYHSPEEYLEFSRDIPDKIALLNEQQERFNQLINERDKLSDEINDDKQVLEQLKKLGNINCDLKDIFSFEFFKFRFGHMPRESYDSMSFYVEDMKNVVFIPSSIDPRQVWGMYFTPKTKSERIDELFKALKFERVYISGKAKGTPAQAKVILEEEIKKDERQLKYIQKRINLFISGIKNQLVFFYEQLFRLSMMYDMRKKAVHTQTSFCITGWIPKDYAEKFFAKLKSIPSVECEIATNNGGENVTPPTLLNNAAVFKSFEPFVEMYGLPGYNEIDPTPFVSITYFLFFGMMFGDVGQGAILIAAGLIMWFFKHIPLGRIIATVGMSSVCFGFIYGSVFGSEHLIPAVIRPMENINMVLMIAVGLGVLMISASMILNIVNGIRQKDAQKTFFSQNGLAGLIMYWAVIVAILVGINVLPPAVSVTTLIIIAVFLLVLIFLREPLAALVEKKKNWIPENKAEFIIINFFECFEILLSLITNTISFIRIGAFALNHVGMMTVVFLLAKTAGGSTNPLVIIIGNLVVIGLEGLIVGIQVLRLEFYEMFGRFYEGSGKPFEHHGPKLHEKD